MSTIRRFSTKEPTQCAVCRRRATGLGFAPSQYEKIIWLCEDKDCHQLAAKVWRMKQSDLDMFEMNAGNDAFNAAAEYLCELGKTDITKLTDIEISEYTRRFIVGHEQGMRSRLLAGTAPF